MVTGNGKKLPFIYFLLGGFLIVVLFIIIHKMKNAQPAEVNQDLDKTKGQRNNNPLNIRPFGKKQPGQTGVTSDKFIVFESVEYGYRTAIKLLWEYYIEGNNTIRKIVNKWAPPKVDNNSTSNYVAFVAKQSGIAADKKLNFNTRDDYDKVIIAMSQYESGMRPTTAQLNKAWELSKS